ncbi:CoA transferase, partial [Mycobacterium kansasii]
MPDLLAEQAPGAGAGTVGFGRTRFEHQAQQVLIGSRNGHHAASLAAIASPAKRLLKANPRLVVARMPAFGLTGPWRDRVGFAPTMEQIGG